MEFPVIISMNGGHGAGGDDCVTLDLTNEEFERLKNAALEYGDSSAELDDLEGISDIIARLEDELRDQVLTFVDGDMIEEIKEEHAYYYECECEDDEDEDDEDEEDEEDEEFDEYEPDEDDIWDFYCNRFSFSFELPEEIRRLVEEKEMEEEEDL